MSSTCRYAAVGDRRCVASRPAGRPSARRSRPSTATVSCGRSMVRISSSRPLPPLMRCAAAHHPVQRTKTRSSRRSPKIEPAPHRPEPFVAAPPSRASAPAPPRAPDGPGRAPDGVQHNSRGGAVAARRRGRSRPGCRRQPARRCRRIPSPSPLKLMPADGDARRCRASGPAPGGIRHGIAGRGAVELVSATVVSASAAPVTSAPRRAGAVDRRMGQYRRGRRRGAEGEGEVAMPGSLSGIRLGRGDVVRAIGEGLGVQGRWPAASARAAPSGAPSASASPWRRPPHRRQTANRVNPLGRRRCRYRLPGRG